MSDEPNRVDLTHGDYLLFDHHQGKYRVAVYTRRVSQRFDLPGALAEALKKSAHSRQVKELVEYISNKSLV